MAINDRPCRVCTVRPVDARFALSTASLAKENTNGLFRQYLPKAADLSSYSKRNLMRSLCV